MTTSTDRPVDYPENLDTSAISNTNLINDAQWAKLAQLSLRSSMTVEAILNGLCVEFDENAPHHQQNLVGHIPTGPTSCLYGMLHHTGSTHT